MSRRARRRRERDLLANTPILDRVLLRPSELALPDTGSLLDAISERIQPSWTADVSVSGPSSSTASGKDRPGRSADVTSPVITIGDTSKNKIPECAAREQRKEVLHALGKTGAGSRALTRPRKPASTVKC